MTYQGVQKLRRKLQNKSRRVNTRYKYYEMKESHTPRNLFVPRSLALKFQPRLGWCTKSVDALADRLQFRGFKNDSYNIQQVFDMNNSDVLYSSAILGALISSCDFIYVYRDKYENVKMQVIDGANATGVMDETTGMLKEGYAVLERDENNKAIIEAYFVTGETWIYEKDNEPYLIENNAPYPLLVPIVNRPDAKRPFGHSRISRSCMKYQNNTRDALTNMYIVSEAYSFPQKYITGLDPDAEPLDKERASMTSLLQIAKGEDGGNVSVGQFNQATMNPYIDEIKTQASLFAGETGLTVDDLGFTSDNPSSYDAIRASHETLRLEARRCQRDFGRGFLNAGYLAVCLRDNYPYQRNQLLNTTPIWEPIFEPDASAIGSVGDAVLKINQAVPGYFDNETIRELTGLEGAKRNDGDY